MVKTSVMMKLSLMPALTTCSCRAPRLRQPVHGFDRSQDVDVGDAVAFGILTGLHPRTREDGP